MKVKILIGNTFPLTLIRKKTVIIKEENLEKLRELLSKAEVYSFWGHENTRKAAEQFIGVSLQTKEFRPTISLNKEGFPMLYGEKFFECWIVSPNENKSYRLAISSELSNETIESWSILKLVWK